MKLSPRTRALLVHDGAIFLTALLATGVLDQLLGGGVTLASLVAAVVVAAKVTLRTLLPVPPATPAP